MRGPQVVAIGLEYAHVSYPVRPAIVDTQGNGYLFLLRK